MISFKTVTNLDPGLHEEVEVETEVEVCCTEIWLPLHVDCLLSVHYCFITTRTLRQVESRLSAQNTCTGTHNGAHVCTYTTDAAGAATAAAALATAVSRTGIPDTPLLHIDESRPETPVFLIPIIKERSQVK